MGSYNTVFGDFNNDGKLDVAFEGTRAFIGDGNGNWIEQSTGLVGGFSDMEKGDLNNDGNLDLIVGGAINTGNGGAGGSMQWTPQNVPSSWYGVAVGDVNNDGKLDIVATPGGIKVWTGNGVAPFVWTDSSGSLPSAGNFWGVALGDINNDGKLDIVAADRSGGIRAWTGNGGTGAGAVWTEATGTGLPSTGGHAGIYLGDVNNDGKLDIAVGLYGGVRVYTGNGGAGGFVWTNNSIGLDTTRSYYQVVLGDINRDGNLDLVGACEFFGIRVWEGNGGAGGSMLWTSAQNALPTTGMHIDVNLGDANNDGKLDIAAASNSDIEVWLNNYPDFEITGYTSISTNLPTASNWYDVVFGDIDNDGKLDLAASSADNLGVRVYRGDGVDTWTLASTGLPTTGNYNGLRLKDVNHDGKLDLSGTMDGGGPVKVWFGDGAGSWTETSVAGSTTMGGGLEVFDVNHDGNEDIIASSYGTGQNVYVYLGDGAGGWSANSGPSEVNPGGYNDVAVRDVNHDGDLDIISTSNDSSVETRLWLGDGTGFVWTLQSPGIPATGVYLGAALGDVNHDGNQDAVLAGFAGSSAMKVYTSDGGDGGIVDWTGNSSGLPPVNGFAGVEFGDLNLDGDLDIVYASTNGAGIGVRTGNGGDGGSMQWTDASLPNLPTTGNYWGIALADVNNDGKLEIGAAKEGGIRVWRIEPTQVPVNVPPELLNAQVVPGSGNAAMTVFTYNVTYRDENNDTPSLGPSVWINKSGIPIGGPYPMIPGDWVGDPSNYTQGRNYSYSTTLAGCGTDYTFIIGASDGLISVYSIESSGPDVNCVPEVLFLGVQSYLEGSAGIGHLTDHAPLLNWTFNDGDPGDVQVAYNVTVWDSTKSILLWFNSTTSSAASDIYNGTGTAIADLVDGSDYWLMVSVFDGIVWSPWNEIQFHMNTPPPTSVPPINPPDDSTIPSSPGQTLSWTSGGLDFEADTITYYWYVDVDNPPVAPYTANDFTTGTSSTPFITAISTDYYWYVNATDGWEWNQTLVWNFTTSDIVNNPPEAQALMVQGFSEGSNGIAHITDHTPDIAWSFFDPDSGDTQLEYDVRVGTSSGGSNMWAPGPQPGGSSSATYAGALLQDGIDYWLSISVFDGYTWSPWNETMFHMNSLEAQALTVQGFAEGTTGIIHISDHTPELSWSFWDAEVGDNQQEYEVRVGTSMGSSDMWSSGLQSGPITSIEYAGLPLIDGTDYWFGVQVNDSYELSGWNETMFHMNALPESQYLTVQGFASGTIVIMHITDHNPVFSWTFNDGDLGDAQIAYNIAVWDSIMSTLLWFNNVTSASTTDVYDSTGTAISALVDGDDYWLKVSLSDGVEWGERNLTQFHMNSKPSQPTLSSPGQGTIGLMPGSQSLDWNTAFDAETDPITYHWYVSEDSSFSSILDSGTTTDASCIITTALATEYFWRVRAFDDYEFSAYSTTWSFRTNRPPSLMWTGEPNYEADGVHPENGNTSTLFTYRIIYTDEDNHAPQTGYPKIVILKEGVEILNESMEPSDASDLDYADGKSYVKAIQLFDASIAYGYYFFANDALGARVATQPKNGPDVASLALRGTIKGRVTDEKGIPLKDVEVAMFVDGTKKIALTDENGRFSFDNLSFGGYAIEFSKSGYETKTLDANLQDNVLDMGIIRLVALEEFPWWLILVLIIIVVVVLIVLFLLKRRKKKPEEALKEKEEKLEEKEEVEETTEEEKRWD